MTDMERLLHYLDGKLRQHDPSPPRVSQWLARISAQARCIQLAACMGIDLRVASISPKVVAGLVSRAEELAEANPTLSASELFQLALKEYPQEELLCACRMPDVPPNQVEYVRVMDFVDFLAFYAPIKATSPAKLEQARRIYPDGTRLGFVKNEFRGTLPLVWVTTHEHLSSILNSKSDDPPATRVARRFGLDNPTNTFGLPPEYVAVKYPLDARIRGYKPTFLDQVWNRDHRFVSVHDDPNWGETLPVPPEAKGVPEHVHLSMLSGLTNSFILWHLGERMRLMPGQGMEVAEVALRRFVECSGEDSAS